MWDSPNWISAAISAKVQERIADKNREANIAMNEAKIEAEKAIADADRESRESVAAADRASKEEIAALDRASAELRTREQVEASKYNTNLQFVSGVIQRQADKELTELRLASNEKIVMQQIESNEWISRNQTTTNAAIAEANRKLTKDENAIQRNWQSAENELDRRNKLEVAGIQAASNVANGAIRVIPMVVSNSNPKGGNSNFTFTGALNAGTESKPVEGKTARQKADDLFPDLEPTFTSNTNVLRKLSMGAGLATLVSAAAGLLTFVPFI